MIFEENILNALVTIITLASKKENKISSCKSPIT